MENNNFYNSIDGTPKTIEELQQWYRDHNLPSAETTRFFIGVNYTNPKAFGIYKEGNEFIVYKNKADGTRSIRYQGEDEAYAVKELFLKLKSEILNQKALNEEKQSSQYCRNSSSDSEVMRVPGNSGSYTGRNINSTMHSDNLGCFGAVFVLLNFFSIPVLIAIGVIIGVIGLIFAPKPTYYKYDNTVYCLYDKEYYEYDEGRGDYYSISEDNLPPALLKDLDEFKFDDDSSNWNSDYSFKDSDYYNTYIYKSDSGSNSSDYDDDDDDDYYNSYDSGDSYDWDSGDSWDSGGSDWDSDW